MAKRALAVVLVLAVAGCTRSVDTPQARPAPQVGPISPLQVGDLLSPEIFNKDGNLFATVEPERCAGVAREVDPPFIVEHAPEARDGGHWSTDVGGIEAVVEEMVAVMPSDFSARDALTAARGTIEACRDTAVTVTTMYGRTYTFRLADAPADPPEGAVLWSLRAAEWNCDKPVRGRPQRRHRDDQLRCRRRNRRHHRRRGRPQAHRGARRQQSVRRA